MADVLDERLMAALAEAQTLVARWRADDGLTWLEPAEEDES